MDLHPSGKSSIGVFTTSTELIVRVWDDALASMTGIDAASAVGKHITEIIPDIETRGLLSRFEFVRDFGTTEVLAPALHKYLIPCSPRTPSLCFDEMRQLVTISALQDQNEVGGLFVLVEDVTTRMEQEKDLAGLLRDADDSTRLQAAKSVSDGLETLRPDDVDPVINALGDKNWRVRRSLVRGLAKRAAPDAVAALLEAVRTRHLDFGMLNSALQILEASTIDATETLVDFLQSDDHDLRMQAALALGKQNNKDAVGPLLEVLADPDANVRYHVIEALGNLRAAEAVEPLLSIVESRDFFLSFAAFDALRQIGDTSSAARISALLDDDLLRDAAASALGTTGNADAAVQIVGLLNEGKLSAALASQAICEIFDRCEATISSGQQIAERVSGAIRESGRFALIEALIDKGSGVAIETIRVAGWITHEDIRERLAALVEDLRVREASLDALVNQGEPAIPILIEQLKSDDDEIRSASAHALAAIDSPAGTDALISAVHSDPRIVASVSEDLARSARPGATDVLVGLLASEDKTLRRASVNALKRFPSADVSKRLFGLLSDVDANLRESAIRVLGEMQTAESRAAVIEGCKDTDEVVRIAALEQLAYFHSDDAVDVLAGSLGDSVPRVRAAAVQALGAFEGETSTRALRRALKDDDPWVRYFAVRSLSANGGGSQSLELFQDLAAGDPAEQVRVAAAEAIS